MERKEYIVIRPTAAVIRINSGSFQSGLQAYQIEKGTGLLCLEDFVGSELIFTSYQKTIEEILRFGLMDDFMDQLAEKNFIPKDVRFAAVRRQGGLDVYTRDYKPHGLEGFESEDLRLACRTLDFIPKPQQLYLGTFIGPGRYRYNLTQSAWIAVTSPTVRQLKDYYNSLPRRLPGLN